MRNLIVGNQEIFKEGQVKAEGTCGKEEDVSIEILYIFVFICQRQNNNSLLKYSKIILNNYTSILASQTMQNKISKAQTKQQKQNRYQKIKKLGQGAYGSVTKVFDHETQQIKALKKIKFTPEDDGIPINALRQISVLKKTQHPNIVKIFDVHYSLQPSCKLYISMQYIQQNLYQHMKRNQPLSPYAIKSYIFQSLTAIAYLHSQGILHRDIKPQNIMLNSQGIIKLCDFGQSKFYQVDREKYSLDVSTLWYRAPEILLGCENYSYGVDIWAIGCVLAEMIGNQPIFKSDCQIGQIFEIFKTMGTPKREIFPNWQYLSTEFPNFPKKNISIKNCEDKALNLITKMLQFDPSKRISAYQALKHEYFQGY